MTAEPSPLHIEQDAAGILQITLHRPDKLNALNSAAFDALAKVLEDAKHNAAVKALLIRGAGKVFCAGADIRQLTELNAQQGTAFSKKGQAVFRQLETLGKPSVAAIHGVAAGGGCELAMAATLRIATDTAQFGLPEVKLGLIPGYGGTQRLARLIGKGRALDLCLTGRFISATEALNWGLISATTTDDQLLPQAFSILSTLLTRGPLALQYAMEAIDHGYNLPLDEALHLEALLFGMCCASPNKNEGVLAFLEKRTPKFS